MKMRFLCKSREKTVDTFVNWEKEILFANFKNFLLEYDEEKIQRKKFLNMNFVLFHLLKYMGHVVDKKKI